MLKYIDGNSKNRPNLEVDMLIKATIALIKFTNLIFCHQKAFLIAYLLPGSNRINENDFFQLPCFVLLKVYFETVLKVFQELQLVTLKIFPNYQKRYKLFNFLDDEKTSSKKYYQ